MSEADDWKTIEDWRLATSCEATLDALCQGERQWRLTLINWGPKCERRGVFEGLRAEVVEQGAKWCRADSRQTHEASVAANLETLERMRAEQDALNQPEP